MLLNRVWGYIILLTVLFLLFQSVFWLAQFPMDAIDWSFSKMNGWLGTTLPEAWWSDLLVNGILAGGIKAYGAFFMEIINRVVE